MNVRKLKAGASKAQALTIENLRSGLSAEAAGLLTGPGALATFRHHLLAWFSAAHRDLPWRRTREPYRIWISEIMLQQTRVQAVIGYYEAFLKHFPTIQALAEASLSSVLAQWSGLGYYSRARNLHRAAKAITGHGAGFPKTYAAIRVLPGIGDYTAAAVASIAFNLPHAALDGNVIRVISRLTNDDSNIGLPATRNRFRVLAGELLDADHPGAFNQAMMELGATVCLPRAPLCLMCPVREFCAASQTGRQDNLPVRIGRAKSIDEQSTVAVILRGRGQKRQILLRQRSTGDARMADFWELPSLEEIRQQVPETPGLTESLLGEIRHSIVNHRYRIHVFAVTVPSSLEIFLIASKPLTTSEQAGPTNPVLNPPPLKWMPVSQLHEIPISTITRKAMALLPAFETSAPARSGKKMPRGNLLSSR